MRTRHGRGRKWRRADFRDCLLDFPGVAGVEEFVEIAGAALGDYVFDLLVHHVFVAGQIIPGAENADRCREAGAMLHVRK